MQSGATIRPERWTRSDDDNRIVTAGAEYNQDHNEAKMIEQFRWVKKIGLGPVFFFVTAVCTSLLLIVELATPAVKQSEINGTTNARLESLATAQRETKEEQAKALAEGIARIEAKVGESNVLSGRSLEENRLLRGEVQAIRAEFGGRLGLVEQKTDSQWNLMVELRTRIGQAEIELKKREKEK